MTKPSTPPKPSYVPRLPIGGAKELEIANRLIALAKIPKLDPEYKARLLSTIKAHLSVHGCYYIRCGDANIYDRKGRRYSEIFEQLGLNPKTIRLALLGLPKRVSNFYLEPVSATLRQGEGALLRTVTIHTVGGEHVKCFLPAEALTSVTSFRLWLRKKNNAAWAGNQSELNALLEDLCHAFASKTK